jgi:hypothetical protein
VATAGSLARRCYNQGSEPPFADGLGGSIAWCAPVRLAETPMEFGHYSNIGEDNSYVFGRLLGMPPGRVDRLVSQGVIY